MESLYRAHPNFKERFDFILTSEDFSKSKPDPECFIKGMEKMGVKPENTIVFEDSIHGLGAGRASGAYVVGLTTTNPADVVKRLADIVIDDFEGHNIEEIMENLPSRA